MVTISESEKCFFKLLINSSETAFGSLTICIPSSDNNFSFSSNLRFFGLSPIAFKSLIKNNEHNIQPFVVETECANIIAALFPTISTSLPKETYQPIKAS